MAPAQFRPRSWSRPRSNTEPGSSDGVALAVAAGTFGGSSQAARPVQTALMLNHKPAKPDDNNRRINNESPAWERRAKARRRRLGPVRAVQRSEPELSPLRSDRSGNSALVVNPENLAHRCDHKDSAHTAPSLPFLGVIPRKAGTII